MSERSAVPEATELRTKDVRVPPAPTTPVPARPGPWSRTSNYARANWLLVAAIAAGLVARIAFWAVTDRRLDDALITIKFAKNVADGVGLVHNLGDGHVYGFTSALSVLVPLPGELIAPGGGILLLRLVSLVAFAVAAVYAYRIARELRLGPWPTGFALAYLALDQNQVFFGMAGMETQIAVAVLLAGVYYVLVEDFTKSGVALGLGLLARPDFVLWVGPAYLFLLVRNPPRALRAGAISAAIVAPWLIFTTIYYGTPIPNTITAKSVAFAPDLPSIAHPGAWIDFLGNQFSAHQGDWATVCPFLGRGFVVNTPLPHALLETIALIVLALALVGAFTTWRRRGWRPAIAFVALFALYKVIFLTVGYFEWYGVPALALLILLAAAGLDRTSVFVAGMVRGRVTAAQLAAVPAICLAYAYAIQLPYVIPLEAKVQNTENHVRVPLGRYLGRVVKPGQTYFSESAGYVGYDTNATLYDYPGLVSATSVSLLQEGAFPSPLLILQDLHPDWLVLRGGEPESVKEAHPQLMARYRPVRRFRVARPNSPVDVGGYSLINTDADFVVLRRTSERGGGRAEARAE